MRILILLTVLLFPLQVTAAPKVDLWPRWQTHNPSSNLRVDHGIWSSLLEKYLITDSPSGINLFRYADVDVLDREVLSEYIDKLQNTPVSDLDRDEQKAFWINAYNSLTVKLILDNYPVKSIRKIPRSWDTVVATVEGHGVTLNDIEHRILRPVWKDNRVHYALNCASIGCPNLLPVAFTGRTTEELLEQAAREYINHSRGARVEEKKLFVSTIYKWYRTDFGGSKQSVIDHLYKYADGDLKDQLNDIRDGKEKVRMKFRYDWNLNSPDGSKSGK
jgi:hypothetical protein